MRSIKNRSRLRDGLLVVAGALIVSQSLAGRVGGAAAPSAATVQGSPQQPASVQADESASLRQGIVTALDPKGMRLQVQGIWLEASEGKTKLIRGGREARLDTLTVGETVRFMVGPGSAEATSMRVIYAP